MPGFIPQTCSNKNVEKCVYDQRLPVDLIKCNMKKLTDLIHRTPNNHSSLQTTDIFTLESRLATGSTFLQ